MRQIILARSIYESTGHPIWPWEVDQFPDDWIDAFYESAQVVDIKRAANAKQY
jgi:hypothetical protein